MSYVFQEYPKWVHAEGVKSRIVATEDDERAFYEGLPAPRAFLIEAATVPVGAQSADVEAPKRRGRPPKVKVSE